MKLWTLSKRIVMFVAVNLLILVGISILLSVLGVQPYLTAQGIDLTQLLAFAAVWGFGGALISLALSRVMAKWMMGVKILSPQTQDPDEQLLLEMVHQLSRSAGLPKMPQVGIYESQEVNAFATGPTRSRALVAVSTGLLSKMDRQSIAGVLAHEVAHIANGDMVTMTLLQGVVNVFVIFFARVAAWALSQLVDEEKRGIVHMVATIVLDIALGILGLLVVSAYSRHREFRADAGGAQLAGTDAMVSALRALKRLSRSANDTENAAPALAALKISSGRASNLAAWFSTHPPLELRIERLENAVNR